MSYQEDKFLEIANAIRTKKSSSSPISALDFASEILSIPSGGGGGDIKPYLDGTLTSTNMQGATSLKPYRFYDFENLTNLDLTGITEIPEYTAQNATALVNLTFDDETNSIGQYAFTGCSNIEISEIPNTITSIGAYGIQNLGNSKSNEIIFKPTQETNLGDYALNNVNIKELQGSFSNIGSYNFSLNLTLTKVGVEINGSIGNYAFSNARNVSDFDISGSITSLGSYAFQDFGRLRENPESNVLLFDLRNSTFSTIGNYCFQGSSNTNRNSYLEVYLPNTTTSIGNYAFRYLNNANVFLTTETIPTIQSQTFNSNADLKIFVPYTVANAYRTATNWSTQSSNIYGWADGNTFENGETLPFANREGYELTWYSDKELTNEITVVADSTQPLYCSVGVVKVAVYFANLSKYQASVVVSDGTNTYQMGNVIPLNTELTITVTGDSGFPDKYIFTVNGVDQTSPYTFNVGENDLSIVAINWDGVNAPLNPTFSLNTPAQVKAGFDNNLALTLWGVGATIDIEVDGLVFEHRIADATQGRYDKVGGDKSNGVLEMTKIYNLRRWAPSSNENYYETSELREWLNIDYYNLLPQEWKDVISEVNIPTATAGNQVGGSVIQHLPSKVFLPSEVEVYNSTTYSYPSEGTIYQYYSGTPNSAKIKQYNGSNQYWWLRSPYRSSSSDAVYVYSSGSVSYAIVYGTGGVSPCFAI